MIDEPETADEWMTRVAQIFQDVTGKMLMSPVDYAAMDALERRDIPLACAKAGIEQSMKSYRGPRFRVSFRYCVPAIEKAFEDWKRATGPFREGSDAE